MTAQRSPISAKPCEKFLRFGGFRYQEMQTFQFGGSDVLQSPFADERERTVNAQQMITQPDKVLLRLQHAAAKILVRQKGYSPIAGNITATEVENSEQSGNE